MPSTLFLGASGYIGGAVLVTLIKAHPEVPFTALVRSEGSIDAISGTGATAIKDSLTDHDALAARVSDFDVVVNCASSSDVALTTAILQGFKKRFEQGKGIGALIHTSGAANFIDFNKEGKADPTAKVWTDSEEDIKQINTHLFHGNVDVPILKAGEEGYVNTLIVAPPGVFGRGNGPVGKTGLFMLGNYIRQGAVTYVGEGSNICSTVHIDDLVDLYKLIFNRALSAGGSQLSDNPYNRYYIPTSGELDIKLVANTYAKALHAKGIVPKAEATQISFDEAGPMAIAWSSNMLVKTVQTKILGWDPKHKVTVEDVVDGLDDGLSRLHK